MEWIQQNIRTFNGNPSQVTIQGHSAGAGDVGTHLLSNLTQGKTETPLLIQVHAKYKTVFIRPPVTAIIAVHLSVNTSYDIMLIGRSYRNPSPFCSKSLVDYIENTGRVIKGTKVIAVIKRM